MVSGLFVPKGADHDVLIEAQPDNGWVVLPRGGASSRIPPMLILTQRLGTGANFTAFYFYFLRSLRVS